MTAGLAPPVAFRNLDLFAISASKRGKGFCDPQLMAPIPCFAEVEARNGVSFDADELRVYRASWCLEKDASDEKAKEAVAAAVQFPPPVRQLAFRINAFGVQKVGIRRTMRAGFSVRASFAFCKQMPVSTAVSKN